VTEGRRHTARLDLRPFVAEDAHALFEIQRDASAMRFTHVADSLEACTVRMLAWEAMRQNVGLAPWVVRETSTQQVIGWGGVGIDPDDRAWGLEAVYFFHPGAWGCGFATELTRFAVATAFDSVSVHSLCAFTHVENMASARVLQKCGFALRGYEPSLMRHRYEVRNTPTSPDAVTHPTQLNHD
jgi:[ribosomal protein S5]-alanine N-acetyltransferase